jgi:hypothetical protein
MVRIQRLVFSLAIAATIGLAKRYAFMGVMSGDGHGPSAGSRLANIAGVEGLSPADASMMTGVALAYCVILGVVSNGVLGAKGLGYYLNSTIAFFGLLATVFVYARIWGIPTSDDSLPLIIAAIAASVLAILAGAFVKTLVSDEVDNFVAGGTTSLGNPAPRRSAKGPSLDRLNMASRRFDY